eukprot:gnl/MRDRNA2_/MRDRNA2_163438_c0_seq1.p1 gnl/MRDRNA2_/MRDRNA2_163438_c0~~gnl/MRDRNA2_/MRDRNA2_163438_c0_seq1.p1  ORF type:complete len:341 (+),score=39.21 gnl/MRDRNA2_/MRDRNA2_163438_c0_seq1:307-1329(+)
MPQCKSTIPQELIRTQLSSTDGGVAVYQRMLDFQAHRFVPDDEDHEHLVSCPSPGCGKFLVPKTYVSECLTVTCPECQASLCAACSQIAHAPSSCKDAEDARMDTEFAQLLDSEDWVRCPVCRYVCERGHGCNFMTCPSERCQGKTYFCYICGEQLTAADRFDHYRGFENAVGENVDGGPVRAPWAYGSVCQNRPHVKNRSLPVKPAPPQLKVVAAEASGLVLRIMWSEHKAEPPIMYYAIHVQTVPRGHEAIEVKAKARNGYVDLTPMKHGIVKLCKYQAVFAAVNVNGRGPPSEPSELVQFSHSLQSTGANSAVKANGYQTHDASRDSIRARRWAVRE